MYRRLYIKLCINGSYSGTMELIFEQKYLAWRAVDCTQTHYHTKILASYIKNDVAVLRDILTKPGFGKTKCEIISLQINWMLWNWTKQFIWMMESCFIYFNITFLWNCQVQVQFRFSQYKGDRKRNNSSGISNEGLFVSVYTTS